MVLRTGFPLALSAFMLANVALSGELQLNGTKWLFAGDHGPAPRTVTFSGDGNVSGHSGCNHYGGEYRYANGRLTLKAIAMTEMACEEPAMQREADFIVIMDKVRGARLEGPELILLGETGNPLARLKRASGG